MVIKLKLSSIFVEDQNKALKFYTEILGFEKKADVPVGEHAWLTVGHKKSEFELLLEPNVHPATNSFQKAIFGKKIRKFLDTSDFKLYDTIKTFLKKFK